MRDAACQLMDQSQGVQNTLLLKQLVDCDIRFRSVVVLVKLWVSQSAILFLQLMSNV